MKKIVLWTALVAAAGFPLAACGGGSEANEGIRTIEIEALDSLAFDPASVEVEAGETLRFVVSNPGDNVHEFVLGDESVQMEHEEQADMGMDHGSIESEYPSAELSPGATETLEVTFDAPGTILYGCHEPGHYEGGMRGTVEVT